MAQAATLLPGFITGQYSRHMIIVKKTEDAPAKPYVNGEGTPLFVADFISPDFGWLQYPDGKQSCYVP